ncbi:MAG: hypothetical protein ABSB35_24420 [Bryobacteraceae bacterium]|jgi:hypothetical protein
MRNADAINDPTLNLDIKDCFASLKKQNETLELFTKTDIILGHDTDTDNVFLVFGRTLLQVIVADNESRPCSVVVVNLRQSTSELELLIAAVQVARGYDDYQSSGSVDRAEVEQLEALLRLDPDNPRLKEAEDSI